MISLALWAQPGEFKTVEINTTYNDQRYRLVFIPFMEERNIMYAGGQPFWFNKKPFPEARSIDTFARAYRVEIEKTG